MADARWMAIVEDLRSEGDTKQAQVLAGYLKTSSLEFFGLKIPAIAAITKRHTQGMSHLELAELMPQLWSVPVYEARRAAIVILQSYARRGDPEIGLALVSDWLDDVDTWALVDPMCTEGLGRLVMRSSDVERTVAEWRNSENFWRRRATILPYLYMSLKRNFSEDNVPRIVDSLRPHLADRQFFVAKAVGWVLRELSKRSPGSVRSFIAENRAIMSPLSIREGSEKLQM
ncbi:MAG: DNA alkylation repair protein [Candidatus Thorarchaeota archaeon]|nr:DNA alkylation repair protein [Candidatus Thorarchaeota archaeon]